LHGNKNVSLVAGQLTFEIKIKLLFITHEQQAI